MNKRAFTLVELLATIVIIGIIMGIILPSATRMSNENKDTIYHKYEDVMEEYASLSPKKNKYYISLSDLEISKEIKTKCSDGYVLIDHSVTPAKYDAYVKCDEYTTPNYDMYAMHFIDELECETVVYNGQEQLLVKEDSYGRYTLTNAKRTEVGDQNVIASITDKSLYSWWDDTQTDKVIHHCKIEKRTIVVTGNNQTKIYDKTALKADNTCNAANLPSGHVVECSNNTGSITNVGTADKIVGSVVVKNGTINVSKNYNIQTTPGILKVEPKPLTATVTANNKQYDGNANATCNGTATLTGVVSGDTVTATVNTSGTFENASVGNNKTVTCSGITLGGTSINNYVLESSTATTKANITKKTLVPSITSCDNKIYDGSTNATCSFGLATKVGSESVSASGTCTFDNANAANNKTITCNNLSLSGTNKDNYALSTTTLTGTANITKQKCNKPTNISIATNGVVTWSTSSNCSSAQHQISIDNSTFSNASSGVDYNSTITSAAGSRTVYVRALAPNNNYTNSDSISTTTTVYTVTLAKGTGISSVSGGGKYITGATPTLGASMNTGYNWSKWVQTSNTNTTVSTTKNYVPTVSSNLNYTAIGSVKIITCAGGKYIAASKDTCDTTCTKGSYCPGGTYTYTGAEQGRYPCSPSCYTSDAGASSCSDSTKPSAYSINNVSFNNTYVTFADARNKLCTAQVKLCNLGTDSCASNLKIKYWTTCSNHTEREAVVSGGCATINIPTTENCSKPSLKYYLFDEKGNTSDTIEMTNIPLRLIIAEIYNHLINRGVSYSESNGWVVTYPGTALRDIQGSMVTATEARNYYKSLSTYDFVTHAYRGILGRDAEDSGRSVHTTTLDKCKTNGIGCPTGTVVGTNDCRMVTTGCNSGATSNECCYQEQLQNNFIMTTTNEAKYIRQCWGYE